MQHIVIFCFSGAFNMSWFAQSNWSQLKGQLSNMTKDLLTETTQETEDPETELAVTRSRLTAVEAQNSSLRSELDQLATRVQVAELRAAEDMGHLKQSQDQVRRLNAQLEAVNAEMNSSKARSGKDSDKKVAQNNASDFTNRDEVLLDNEVETEEWQQPSQLHNRAAVVVGDDALEQAQAEAEYWRMIATSNQQHSPSPDAQTALKANNELARQLQEFEHKLNDERAHHESEIIAIRELYERRLAEAETQNTENDSNRSSCAAVKEASINTLGTEVKDAFQQTELEVVDGNVDNGLSTQPSIATAEKSTATVNDCDSGNVDVGCNTLETALTTAKASANRRSLDEQLKKNISKALDASDLSTLAACLLAAGELAFSHNGDENTEDFYENVDTSKLVHSGAVWRALNVQHSDGWTSTLNDLQPLSRGVDTQTTNVVCVDVNVQCEAVEEDVSAKAKVSEESHASTFVVATVDCTCQTDSSTDSSELEEKHEAELAHVRAERDHFSAAAHQQHSEAVRLFGEVERWRVEVDRLRSHLVQMESEYTAAAVASEQREKELRDKLAASSEAGPALETAVKERNSLQEKLRISEADTKRLSKQISALQTALEQLQLNSESQFSIERDRMQKEVSQLKRDLESARLRAAETTVNVERLRRLTEQLASSEQDVSRLKTELERLNTERLNAVSLVSELRATLSDCIERKVIRGLIAACLHAPPGQRQLEALHLVAKIVGVTEEEMKQAATMATSRSTTSPSSLGEMFVKFLETESSSGVSSSLRLSLAPVGSPASSIANSQQSTPSPSPSSLFGRWPFSGQSQQQQRHEQKQSYDLHTPTSTAR